MTTHLVPCREEFLFPLQKEFDKLFDTMFGPKRLPSLLNSLKSHSGYPKLDVLVTDGRYRIEAAVPGVPPEELKVEILPGENGERVIRISGKMAHDYQYSKDTEYHYRELTRAKFQRVVSLPNDVKGDPEAVVQDGMLTLTWLLEKPEPSAEVKVIPIQKV
jgi:HSP20 family molecular chaperone IbpA